jgi:acyl carrier protein
MELQILRQLIEDEFDETQVDEQTGFYDDLGADWLDMVEMMFACEEEFDIEIGEEKMKQIQTVGELAALVRKLAGE